MCVFKEELDLISDSTVRDFTNQVLNLLPDYFFTMAASTTGKYHPSYALGEGGLVRHTKAAVRIANDLLNLDMFKVFLSERDYIISALILHDGCKCGLNGSRYTVIDHPLIVSKLIKSKINQVDIINKVCSLIDTHMGQWNTDYRTGNVVLPKPESKAQNFVHLCDYLASRKFLEFNFEV
jgi:hypothetical protein